MATMMPSPATTRMPFGEINGARLQNLTSMKNRQNAITSLTSPSKRKAQSFDDDIDAENIDPSFFSPKRSKGASSDFTKPTTTLFVKPSSPIETRKILQPRSTPKISTNTITSTLSAPAGRSPTNKKRIGILNRRRTIQRVDPPSFSLTPSSSTTAAPFSLGAALAGTIPSYKPRTSTPLISTSTTQHKASWDFIIHEDTAEEEMQILMEHGACTLDISSDEETERRLRDERGKENVPPVDDISQSQARLPRESRRAAAAAAASKEKAMDIDRCPLGDLVTEDFFAEGVKEGDVILVNDEEDNHEHLQEQRDVERKNEGEKIGSGLIGGCGKEFEFTVEAPVKGKGRAIEEIEALMMRSSSVGSAKAALLEPIEKAEEDFEVWESGSAKGDE